MLNFILPLILLIPNLAFAGEETCLLGKEEISWYNGATTNGKSGVVVCKNKEGTITQRATLKDGKKIGPQMMTFGNGERQEWTQDEKGRKQGSYKRFKKSGVAVESRNQIDGNYVGLQEDFFDSGKPRRVFWQEAGASSAASEIEFLEDGAISGIKCSIEKSYTNADKAPCGFSGAKTTWLMSGSGKKKSEVTYKNGVNEKKITYGRKGEVVSESNIVDGLETEKVFFEDGKVKEENSARGRAMLSELEYFMNGSKKREAKFTGDIKNPKKHEIIYWDNGKIQSEGDYVRGGYRGWSPVGTLTRFNAAGTKVHVVKYSETGKEEFEARYFNDTGKLADETTFKEGRIFRTKIYDENGIFKFEKEFFADGSSKLISGKE